MANVTRIPLKSSDGVSFEVDEAVVRQFQAITCMFDDDCLGDRILLDNVSSKILPKVIEYCEKHVQTPNSEDHPSSVDDELKSWDAEFVKVDHPILFDLILAANYLNIKSLLDLTSQIVGT